MLFPLKTIQKATPKPLKRKNPSARITNGCQIFQRAMIYGLIMYICQVAGSCLSFIRNSIEFNKILLYLFFCSCKFIASLSHLSHIQPIQPQQSFIKSSRNTYSYHLHKIYHFYSKFVAIFTRVIKFHLHWYAIWHIITQFAHTIHLSHRNARHSFVLHSRNYLPILSLLRKHGLSFRKYLAVTFFLTI